MVTKTECLLVMGEDSLKVRLSEKSFVLFTDLSREYMKYRLCNTSLDDNYPSFNAEQLGEKTDKEIYGDYITYQAIDSASDCFVSRLHRSLGRFAT